MLHHGTLCQGRSYRMPCKGILPQSNALFRYILYHSHASVSFTVCSRWFPFFGFFLLSFSPLSLPVRFLLFSSSSSSLLFFSPHSLLHAFSSSLTRPFLSLIYSYSYFSSLLHHPSPLSPTNVCRTKVISCYFLVPCLSTTTATAKNNNNQTDSTRSSPWVTMLPFSSLQATQRRQNITTNNTTIRNTQRTPSLFRNTTSLLHTYP